MNWFKRYLFCSHATSPPPFVDLQVVKPFALIQILYLSKMAPKLQTEKQHEAHPVYTA